MIPRGKRHNGGEGGIRTHEGLLTLAGFQDQCIRPLCHLSVQTDGVLSLPPEPDSTRGATMRPRSCATMLAGLRSLETRMRYSQYRFRLRHDNPLVNALLIVLGALAMAALLVVGLVAVVVLGGIVVTLAALVGLRFWWLNRRFGRQGAGAVRRRDGKRGALIEGEYRSLRPEPHEARRSRRSQES